MEKNSSDALALDELLLFLEQVSDAPFAADAAFVSPAPVDAPLVCLLRQEVRSEAHLAAAHVDTQTDDRQGHDGDVLGTDSAVAEPMSATEEPTFSPEECNMLLLVLQDTASEAEDHGDAKDDARSEQARSIGGGCYCTSSSGSGSESSVSESSVATRGTRQGTHRNDESDLIMDTLSATDSHPKAQQPPRRKQARRPDRRRRKHDIDELRDQVQELIKELVRLRVQGQSLAALSQIQQQKQQGGAGNKLLEMETSVESSEWQLAAVSGREKTRVAMLENARLRTQYEQQLQVLQRLQAMARNQFDFASMGGFSVPGRSLTKRLRLDPFDDDFAIFAALGQNFDTQYDEIDNILEAAGLLHFDGELAAELRAKTDSRGKFFMESMHSRVIHQDMFIMDRAINETSKSPKLHQHHKFHEVRHATDTISFTKFVDDIRLPHAEATLTVRMAIKRFAFPDRVAGVWESVIDISGCVSMRLHEKGWNALRPPRVLLVNQSSGPLSIEQSCVRYFPIDSSVSSEQDLAVGTVNRILVDSYRSHLHRMHEITDDILSKDFDKLSLA